MASKPIEGAGRQQTQFQQFIKQATNKVVLDVSYAIFTDTPDDEQGFAGLPEEKIIWTLVDYQRTPHVTLRHFMNASTFRVLAWDILIGRFPRVWTAKDTDAKRDAGKPVFPHYEEYKGSRNAASQNGKPEARHLTISMNPDPARDYPWQIKIERGLGELMGKGAVKMVQVQDTVQILLADLPMRSIAAEGLEFLQAQRALRVSMDNLAML